MDADAGAVMTTLAADLGRMRTQRLARLRVRMRAQNVHGAVLLHGPNITYATGFAGDAVDASHANHCRAVAIVSADDEPARIHVHGAVGETDAECGPPLWPELDDGAGAMKAAIADGLGDICGRRIAVDAVTGAMARTGVVAGAELIDANGVLGPARLVKTNDELACIDLSQRWTERAMAAARAACVPGVRRSEVAGTFLAALKDPDPQPGRVYHNWIDPIFQPMPNSGAGGPRTGTGHVAFPTGVGNPTFAEGDLVWVDAGVGYEGYMSDFGRTWVVGRDPTPAEQSLFARWSAVLAAGCAATRPGATLGDVGRAARTAEPSGETPWLPYFYLAHGVGLESAEMPMIGTDLGPDFDDDFELEPGMVLVFEPVIWADGVGGYRAEEIVAVTDDGWQLLGGGHHYEPFQS